MILSLEHEYELDLPAGWHEMPPAAVLRSADWVYEWIEGDLDVPSTSRENLARALEGTAQFVVEHDQKDRVWIALIDPTFPEVVLGVASIIAYRPTVNISPGLVGTASTPPLPRNGSLSWARQKTTTTLANLPAIVLHELLIAPVDGVNVVTERYVGTVFPDFIPLVVQLELLATDLTVFADIVQSGDEILEGLRFTGEHFGDRA
jgi:hypothetical protein